MSRKLLLIILSFLMLNVYSQDVLVGNQGVSLYDCNNPGSLYDSGGSGASYSAGESFVVTICSTPLPPAGIPIALEFVSANFGHQNDFLAIYDGANTTNAADLLYSFTQTSSLSIGAILRTSILNTAGCITVQFVSDIASTGGNFDFDIVCLPPCKSVMADMPVTSIPVLVAEPNYINLCLGEELTLTGSGIYDVNTGVYAQSDATSTFYWDFGPAGIDTGQVVTTSFNSGIYSIKLTVEDASGCQSLNEIDLKVRQALIPDISFSPADTTVCLDDELDLIPYLITTVGETLLVGDTLVFDTLKVQTKVTLSDTTYFADDADGISGNGITTPGISLFPIFGYQPGATLQNVNDMFYVCIDIEHSFVGDLDVILECPNGQTVSLINFSPPTSANGWNLGEPMFGTTPGDFGVPYTYCWSPSANIQDTIGYNSPTVLAGILPNGAVDTSIYYSTNDSWNNLIGCPLNGVWSIQVFDDFGGDDGNLFGAAIEFDGAFALNPDTFVVAYENPNWNASNQILSNLNNDSVSLKAVNLPFQPLTFNFEDNLGCSWSADYGGVIISTVQASSTFEDTTICGPDSLKLQANVAGYDNPCTYTLEMFDDFGDGWSGNFITVLVDGIDIGLFEVDNAESDTAIEFFSAPDGAQIDIQYTDTGSFPFEISFNLLDPTGNVIFADGPSPLAGISFTTIANCFGPLTFNWGPTSEIVSTNSNQATIYPTGASEYYLEVINEFGCLDKDTSYVQFDPTNKPIVDFSTLQNKFCCVGANEETEINIDVNDYISGPALAQSYWNDDLLDQNSFDVSSSDFNGDTLPAIIKIVSVNGCFVYDTLAFYKYCIDPSIAVSDSIFVGESMVFDMTVTEYDSMSYLWTTSSISTGAITDATVQDAEFNGLYESSSYDADAKATAYFTQNDGTVLTCAEDATTKSYAVVDVLTLEYPDAFTPNNGDALNNLFKPVISEYAKVIDFRIYNRWGAMVYDMSTAENKEGWDGTYQGKDQEAGVYTYYLNVNHFNDNFMKESTVTLIR
jgi:gliding motility-associated-like protein